EIELRYKITNSDRTVGAALGGAIALEWGQAPPRGTACVRFDGSDGQSFGAFLTHGIDFELAGEANDYVRKGMPGGPLVIRALAEVARPDAELLEEFRWLVERHHELTQSPRARQLLDDWANTVEHVWVVAPLDRVRRIEAEQAGKVSSSA